jgi:hypothetical protein
MNDWRMAALAVSLACSACSQHALTAAQSVDSGAAPAPSESIATVQDLMRYEVDPSADHIWDSVGSITTSTGTVERQPRTDAEWAELRRNAVILVEATNLLVLPGRQVAAAEFPADGPGVLSSAEIQQRLSGHQAEFDAFAVALRGTARKVLAAVDARDPAALLQLGEQMDSACEACHLANWYPHEVIPRLPAKPPAAP